MQELLNDLQISSKLEYFPMQSYCPNVTLMTPLVAFQSRLYSNSLIKSVPCIRVHSNQVQLC